MRSAVASVALFAASVSAYTLFNRQGTIVCGGNNCVVPSNLGCSVTDTACLCNNDAYLSSTLACIEPTCANITAAEQVVQQLCNSAGVTITAFPTGSATGTASASSSTPTVLGPASNQSTSALSGAASPSNSKGAVSSTSKATSSSSTGSTAASTGSTSAKGRSSTPIGPIVGGVVGVLALLAISGFIYYFFYIRPKRDTPVQGFTPEDSQRTEKPLDSEESPEMLNSGQFSLLGAPTDTS